MTDEKECEHKWSIEGGICKKCAYPLNTVTAYEQGRKDERQRLKAEIEKIVKRIELRGTSLHRTLDAESMQVKRKRYNNQRKGIISINQFRKELAALFGD